MYNAPNERDTTMNTKPTFIKLDNIKKTSIINLAAITAIERITPENRDASFNYLVEVLGENHMKKFYIFSGDGRWSEIGSKRKSTLYYRITYDKDCIIVNEAEFNRLEEHINIIL